MGEIEVPPFDVRRGGETCATVVHYGLSSKCAIVRDIGCADSAIPGECMRLSADADQE